MVFNTTFNNISVISWRSVVFVEETGVPGDGSIIETGNGSIIETGNGLIIETGNGSIFNQGNLLYKHCLI